MAYEPLSQALGAWLIPCVLYRLHEVLPTSSRPLCIIDKLLLLNPTDDAFHAVRENAARIPLSITVHVCGGKPQWRKMLF